LFSLKNNKYLYSNCETLPEMKDFEPGKKKSLLERNFSNKLPLINPKRNDGGQKT
jgi:hypothetical protein